MIPVDQLNQHHPEGDGPTGDCFRACVASIFELVADAVPHFVDRPEEVWVGRLRQWLTPRGLGYIVLNAAHDRTDWPWVPRDEAPAWVILGGASPRGNWGHNCVGQWSRKGLSLVHDPHPSRAGLVGEPEDFGLFYLLDPIPRQVVQV